MQGSDAFEPAPSAEARSPRRPSHTPSFWSLFGPRSLGSKLRESVRAARAFENWPAVLRKCLLSYVIGPRGDLVVRTRTGLVLRCPNDPLDRWPIFEVIAIDAYHLGQLAKELDSSEPLIVLDIGAHVGAFALELARRFPHCTVLCYEPNPRILPYIRHNIRANGMADRILVEQRAVGAAEGRATLYDAGGSSTILPGLRTAKSATEVEVVTFGEAMTRLGGRADLVKLDCEGSEYAIILETSEITWRQVERVVLEYEEPIAGCTWQVLRRRLEALGFEVDWHEKWFGRPDLGMAHLTRAAGAAGRDHGHA